VFQAASSPPPPTLGDYTILGRLGEGGMASVYLARPQAQPSLRVAIKVLQVARSDDPVFVDMFLDEIRIAGRVHHPNIVRVLDSGIVDQRAFLVMELLDGLSLGALHDRLARARAFAEVAWIGAEAARGLAAAHSARDEHGELLGLIHRDVTPSNVMVTRGGDVKLIDFGVAKASGRRTRTTVGILKGKAAYLAPEQILGAPAGIATDVFSLAVTLWELASGVRLFKRPNQAVTIEAIHQCEVPDLRRVVTGFPPQLWKALAGGLARAPGERHANGTAFALALDACSDGESSARSVRELVNLALGAP